MEYLQKRSCKIQSRVNIIYVTDNEVALFLCNMLEDNLDSRGAFTLNLEPSYTHEHQDIVGLDAEGDKWKLQDWEKEGFKNVWEMDTSNP